MDAEKLAEAAKTGIAGGIANFALGQAQQIDASKYTIKDKDEDKTLLVTLSLIGGITAVVLIVILLIILKK